ncbi:MAG: SDR family oxidoreductase [Deltaproteobacteria bacterium]|nr:MAG: SDR family oxidoreductase [Deltaproteobacteria bacterium]
MRTVFITGASAGFGAACARRFAQAGDRLILTARRLDKLEQLRAELGDVPVHLAQLDVRDQAAVRSVVAGLPAGFGDVDILVNNAGLALGLEPSWQVDMTDWEQMIDTNIKGLLYCTHALLAGMVERRRGHVINIGSIAGSWPYAGGNVYGATKAFVLQFTRNLRTDLHGTGVRATCIAPGMAETEFSMVRFKGDEQKAARVYEGTRALTAEDIAECVFWCASLPEHVNINQLEVMSTDQTWGATMIYRGEGG